MLMKNSSTVNSQQYLLSKKKSNVLKMELQLEQILLKTYQKPLMDDIIFNKSNIFNGVKIRIK
ncbi:unnamed protein product [Paramecium primaurelia]|uniref:Uncharacterized protein n=1 Tax=Paramecium primaurelia TaxID=5886 RepID=A0A8S1JQP0_PARPR|nr:unnamed protein product [Paramecium primaurelia]